MKHLASKSPFSWRAVLATTVQIAFLALLFSGQNSARAEGLNLLLNGVSFHQSSGPKEGGEFNERNWGLGLQTDFNIVKKHWVPYLTISAFKDSHHRNSFYAGGGMLRRFPLSNLHKALYFDAGLAGFAMTRKDHHNRKPFLGVLPAFSFGTDKLAINASYIPKVEPKLSSLLFFQLKISLDYFNSN